MAMQIKSGGKEKKYHQNSANFTSTAGSPDYDVGPSIALV